MGKKYYKIEITWRNAYVDNKPLKTFIGCDEDLIMAIVNNLLLFDISGIKIIKLRNTEGEIVE